MRLVLSHLFYSMIAALLVAAPLQAQQAPDSFRWIDFHSAQNQKDQDVIAWVTRSLAPDKWTAIREIGVEYDAALVVTTLRATPQSEPAADTFTVWNLSLTSHVVAPLLTGVNLRLLDWMLFAEVAPRELGALYDDCIECEATTYITAFYYDPLRHMWVPRWLRGNRTVPVWIANPPAGVALTQVYAVLAEPNGRQLIGTWNHIDHGKQEPAEDSVYRFDIDPFSGLERTQLLSNKQAEAMEQRLCAVRGTAPGLALGQDSALCQQTLKASPERKPVTTPPAGNHGQSVPPTARR
jgi:hypothetical protein